MSDKVLSGGVKHEAKVVLDTPNKSYVPTTSPVMSSGGNAAATINGGATPVQLANLPCSQVTIANNTGTALEVQQGGAGDYFPVLDGTYYTFFGISNANQLSVRRVDVSATSVTLKYRWEK